LILKASQTQSHASVSFFEMPLPIRVNGAGGQVVYLRPQHTANDQYFTAPVNFQVTSVEFNYNHDILEKNSTVTLDNTLAAQEISVDEVSLYPVPAWNELFFRGVSRKADFRIYSADGKLVKAGTYIPEKAIPVSELPPGNYVITITGRNFKFTKK